MMSTTHNEKKTFSPRFALLSLLLSAPLTALAPAPQAWAQQVDPPAEPPAEEAPEEAPEEEGEEGPEDEEPAGAPVEEPIADGEAEEGAAGEGAGEHAAGEAGAEAPDDTPARPEKPYVFHTPRAAHNATQPMLIEARVSRDWELESLVARVRAVGATGEEGWQEVALERAGDRPVFQARVPSQLVQPPGLEYYLVSQARGGAQREHFGTAAQPHQVLVVGETAETRRAARLARHEGATSVFRVLFRYTSYGSRPVVLRDRQTGEAEAFETISGSEAFAVTEVDYHYRVLEMPYAFGFGVGWLQGSFADVVDDGVERPVLPVTAESTIDPALYYGFGDVTFELHRNFSLDGKVLLGAASTGFTGGLGGTARIGRIAGTRLELGAEQIWRIGYRTFMRFAWDTVPNFPMALLVERGTFPAGDLNPAEVRLIFELGVDLGDHFFAELQGGYATRDTAFAGGPVLGLQLGYGL